ncbi:hypothetical protein HDU82_006631 [Entophlyctis luteolus]|nr:hypothetical protein HDU82_006631 [Entophlyctis luteolus]
MDSLAQEKQRQWEARRAARAQSRSRPARTSSATAATQPADTAATETISQADPHSHRARYVPRARTARREDTRQSPEPTSRPRSRQAVSAAAAVEPALEEGYPQPRPPSQDRSRINSLPRKSSLKDSKPVQPPLADVRPQEVSEADYSAPPERPLDQSQRMPLNTQPPQPVTEAVPVATPELPKESQEQQNATTLPAALSSDRPTESPIPSSTSGFTVKQGQTANFPTVALRAVEKRGFKSEPALYRVKGRRKFHVTSVSVSPVEMSSSDVYILEIPFAQAIVRPKDNGTDFEEVRASLFVWYGSGSGMVKKARGKEVAYRMREKDWRLKAEIVEVWVVAERNLAQVRFWSSFPRSEEWGGGILTSLSKDFRIADDLEYEKNCELSLTLYGVNDDDEFVPIASGKDLSMKVINSGACFVLESKAEAVFVWMGRTSTELSKEAANKFANTMAELSKAKVIVERDLSESVLFMEKFQDWTDKVSIEVVAPRNIKAKDKTRAEFDRGAYVKASDKIDVYHMLNPPKGIASWERQADGSTEKIDVGGPPPKEIDRRKLDLKSWMAIGTELVDITDKQHGVFFSGDCYLFLYRHTMGREGNEKEVAIVYFWIGDDSKATEAGTIAHAAVDLERKHDARQVRVSQGHEPEHFLSIFRPVTHKKGEPYDPIIVRRGVPSMVASTETALFRIGGCSETQVQAVQVAWNVSSFDSASVFLVVSKNSSALWVGSGAFDFELTNGRKVAAMICGEKPLEQFNEFEEPSDFWQKFGVNQGEPALHSYASCQYLQAKRKYVQSFKRRLWKVSHVFNGGATIEHIEPFAKTDLNDANVYILDGFFEIFVWIGHKAQDSHKDVKLALGTAIEYAEYAQGKEISRGDFAEKVPPVWMVHEGEETPEFKACFLAFDDGAEDLGTGASWQYFTWLQEEIRKKKVGGQSPRPERAKAVLEVIETGIFSVEDVRAKKLPIGINPATAELHLSDSDFMSLFGIDKEAYNAHPNWKRVELKKKAGLF